MVIIAAEYTPIPSHLMTLIASIVKQDFVNEHIVALYQYFIANIHDWSETISKVKLII